MAAASAALVRQPKRAVPSASGEMVRSVRPKRRWSMAARSWRQRPVAVPMERRGGAPERWMGREGGSRASAGAGHGAASAAAGGEERGSARSGDRGRSVVYPDERTQVTAPGTPGKTTGNRSSWRRGTVVRRFMVGSMVKRPRNFGLSRPRALHRHFPCGPDRCSIGGVMLAALLTTGFFAATAVFARRGGCRRACGPFARAPQPSRTGAQGGGRVWPPLVPHVERRHRGAARDGRAVGHAP